MSASLWLLAALTAASPALERCRALDQGFKTRAMPGPCSEAAADIAAPAEERAEAYRLLAFAQIVNGAEREAEKAFVRMLVLTPESSLPPDASPRFRDVFQKAKVRYEREGKLDASVSSFAPPQGIAPANVAVDLKDPLGRVASARVSASASGASVPTRAGLVRTETGFEGTIVEPLGARQVHAEIELISHDGRTVLEALPLDYVRQPASGNDVKPPLSRSGQPDGEVDPIWLWVGVGGGAVVVGAAALAGVAWAYTDGPLAPAASVTVIVQ